MIGFRRMVLFVILNANVYTYKTTDGTDEHRFFLNDIALRAWFIWLLWLLFIIRIIILISQIQHAVRCYFM